MSAVAGEPLLWIPEAGPPTNRIRVDDIGIDTPDAAGSGDDDHTGSVRRHKPVVRSRRRRYANRVVMIAAVLLMPVVYSYGRALTGAGNDSMQARTVEWAREHHLGSVVDRVEKYWYSKHQAQVGGTPASVALGIQPATAGAPGDPADPNLSALPGVDPPIQPLGRLHVAGATRAAMPADPSDSTTRPTVDGRSAAPAALVSPAVDAVANEGQWTSFGPQTDGVSGMYATLIRPDAEHTSILDAVVSFDSRIVKFRQYPGLKIPGGPWDRPAYVEPALRSALVAAFAGGFRLADSHGGMFLGGRTLQPLRTGGATFMIDASGVPTVGMWGRDVSSTNGLDSARQNLDLIVDGGVLAPELATDANRTWGFTGPANHDAVWRSGAGITADGRLIWVGGNGLTIVALAETLVRAGVIRGMQLDINNDWVQFNTYAADSAGVVHGKRLLANMQHSDDRYLSVDTRDFIAVFTRTA
jgi:hypothetical protein